jgi:hypothetical protein
MNEWLKNVTEVDKKENSCNWVVNECSIVGGLKERR